MSGAEPPSSLPGRASGIPRPASRLPVLRPSGSQSQIRPPSSAGQLSKKPSIPSLSKPTLQKKPSRTSLARPPAASAPSAANTGTARASGTSAPRRTVPSSSQPRNSSGSGAAGFRKPIGRPPSRQTRVASQPSTGPQTISQEEDQLGDLDAFRSASTSGTSSRAGFRDDEQAYRDEDGIGETDQVAVLGKRRAPRPSLSDRTIESLSQVASPVAKGRRQSNFFNVDNSMPPPRRPASALGARPTTSDGTPQGTPATPKRSGGVGHLGAMTAPGKRSVSATTPTNATSTPSRMSSVKPLTQLRKLPLAQVQNTQNTPKARPLSTAKTMTGRTPKSRPSLAGTFTEATSPPETAGPIWNNGNRTANGTPGTVRRVPSSSAALREQLAKAKAERLVGTSCKEADSPRKASNSSNALREQIAKAKEAARRAHAVKQVGRATPPREVPAVTEKEFCIQPDPAEIAGFDFGLDDPFNQLPKGSKSLLRRRIDGARADGRLNLAALGLNEVPDEVLTMYKYDPNDNSVAWGEVVDLTVIIAADNELEALPERMFPDVDYESTMDSDDDDGPQFGAVQNLDLHGNALRQLPVGLRRLTQLTKLNLSRNQLPLDALDVICQVTTLRELRIAENALQGALPASLGALTQLEVLELQGNKLTSLPDEVRELVRLRTLNVSSNELEELPSELFTSTSLMDLNASKNKFRGPFFRVNAIPHLQSLNVSYNSLSSLCETEAINLPNLTSLDITACRLTTLPDISTWTGLTTLLAGQNKLTALPEGFIRLQQLRTADFTSNDMKKLDERVALMNGLENLTVAANPFREAKFLTMNTEDLKRALHSRLEPGLLADAAEDDVLWKTSEPCTGWELKPGGTLDLSSQNLTELDIEALSEFSASNDVRQLYLQQNSLTTIPSALAQLSHLTVLNLSQNSIEDPFREIVLLPKLKELRLPGNKLRSLEGLTTFLTAPHLQHLDVSHNRITGELPTLRLTFPELILLNASQNEISKVRAVSLRGLKIVNLSSNDISRLDPEIGLLAGSLTSLEVEGNTFRVPNFAVLRKGTDAVLAWLRDKIPEPVVEEGGAGASPAWIVE